MTDMEGMNIICLSSSHYDSVTWVNSQHLMSRFAGKNRVLYVEPLSLRFPSGGRGDLSKIVRRIRGWSGGVRQVNDSLWVYSPLVIPLHRFRGIRALNRLIVRSALRRIQKRLSLSDPILWIFLPTGVDMVGSLGEKLVIYHCVDNYEANPRVDRTTIRELELRLLEKADLVFTTARSLLERLKKHNRQTFYIPSGVDSEHFGKALLDETRIPSDLESIHPPRAGFIGAVSGYKVDTELLATAASQLPDISFVLVGPVGSGDPATDISILERSGNIHLLGARPYDQLPAYLKGFDTCMIPFRINETTGSVFPVKFLEYLSSGKPVVSTALPELADYSDRCYIVSDPGQFASSIRASIDEDTAEDARERVSTAAGNSWDSRTREISGRIAEWFERSGLSLPRR